MTNEATEPAVRIDASVSTITAQDLLTAIENGTADPTAMPVVVTWPDNEGDDARENRRPIRVVVQNDGDPEVPTLMLLCGAEYDR